MYPKHTEDYLILDSSPDKKMLKVQFNLSEWSVKAMLSDYSKYSPKDIIVEMIGSWSNWRESHLMEIQSNSDGIKTWTKVLSIEDKTHMYKFKLNGKWFLDPYRRLSEDGVFENHFFDPFQDTNKTITDFTQDTISHFSVTLKQNPIKDIIITDLWGHSMNLIQDQLFIIGGVGRNSFQNIMYQIDLRTMKLRQEHMDDKNAPEMLAFHKSVAYGDKLIIYGGQNEYEVSNKYHTFNTKTRQWTTYKLSNKIGLREHFSVCYKEQTCRIYFFGGYYFHPDYKQEKQFNDLWVLNLKHMSFEMVEAGDPPKPRCHHTAAMFDWKMYIYGGCQINNYQREVFDDLYEIDLSQDKAKWVKIECEIKPPRRFGHISTKFQKYMIIHGGKGSRNDLKESYLGDLWTFDITRKQWSQIDYSPVLVSSFHTGCIY